TDHAELLHAEAPQEDGGVAGEDARGAHRPGARRLRLRDLLGRLAGRRAVGGALAEAGGRPRDGPQGVLGLRPAEQLREEGPQRHGGAAPARDAGGGLRGGRADVPRRHPTDETG
ncbi:unnamed protein product, partial [Prorocentrum cordatum]